MDSKEELNLMPSCAICGGQFAQQTITHRQPWGDELFEFENVPALVCVQCGEVWLDAQVTQLIEQVILQQPEPKRFRQIPVFSLNELTLTR